MNCPRCSVAVPGPGACPWCGYAIPAPAATPDAGAAHDQQPAAGAPQAPPQWQQPPGQPGRPPQWQQPPGQPGQWPGPPGYPTEPAPWQYGTPPGASQYAPTSWKGATDGFPYAGPGSLASPWRRLGARLIDYLIFLPVFLVLLAPVIADVVEDFDRISQLPTDEQSAEIEQTVESAFDDRVLYAIAVLGLAVFVYEVAMLAWRGATVGKLALGLRVVPFLERDRPAVPVWTAVLRTGLPALVGLIPVVGPLGQALDALWCLWDPRRQCVHDKVARTVVVRTRY